MSSKAALRENLFFKRFLIIDCYTENLMNRDNQQERLIEESIHSDIPEHIGWYLSGFADGEGSFNISFRCKQDYRNKWQPVLSFNVSQRDMTVLAIMQKYLRCGISKQRKDGLYSYDVSSPQSLELRIIPFFHKFVLLSLTKGKNFQLFREAVKLMFQKRHLTQTGLRELVEIREQINEGRGRKRKYLKSDILLESSETIR